MPDRSSGLPKVKRLTPVTGSVPMAEIIRPSSPAIRPFTSESPETVAMTLRPSTPSAKYAVGVNARARFDNGSVRSTSTSSPNRPPTKPEYNEIPSASPALPCSFIA